MDQNKMSIEQAEAEGARPFAPGRVRVEISGADGETKVAAAEALSDLARATLSAVKIAVPGHAPLEGLDAFSISYAYHETGFELSVEPRLRVFRKALGGAEEDIIASARRVGARLPLFQGLALRAAQVLAPQAYERGSRAMLDLLARQFAQAALGGVMASMQASVEGKLPAALEAALPKPRAPRP